jgi:hypothetical protein
MKQYLHTVRIGLAGLVGCLLLLAACATTSRDVPEQQLRERSMARWDALLSGDLAAAYGYLSPATRSSVSSLQYQRSILLQRVTWTDAEYLEEDCEETTCKVKISLGFVVQGGLPGVQSFADTEVVDETWLLVDGAWYYVPPQ